jgi:lipid-A-disaccharide synthase
MRIMISCGEASGDLYAAALARELRRLVPDVDIFGFGGPRLEAAGARLIGDFSGISVTGLAETLRVIPRSVAMLRRLVASARLTPPDVLVAVDFSGFNFRLMAAVRRLGAPVVYYVSPQLWAWRTGRMKTMKASVDRVLVIFPFEEEVYRRASVPVQFVGHPLVDLARATQPRADVLQAHGLRAGARTVALLPGSRRNELRRIALPLIAALPLVRARVPDVQFMVARAPGLPDALFAPFAASGVPIVAERADDVIAASDVVVTASGTATVQCALHERPMVVVYRLSPITYRLGKPFVKLDTYAMPNLVAGRRIVPELIQDALTPRRIADETVALLSDADLYRRTCDGLRQVRRQLGAPGASARAASAVLEVARGAKSA